jgi:predicted XRE-type DNA-binding protein
MSINVFADLDLPKPNELFLRAGLLLELGKLMRESGMTQVELAAKAGLKQPEISRILNGKDRGFSTDRLARIAFKLGTLPMIKLQPMPEARSRKPKRAARKAA